MGFLKIEDTQDFFHDWATGRYYCKDFQIARMLAMDNPGAYVDNQIYVYDRDNNGRMINIERFEKEEEGRRPVAIRNGRIKWSE